MRRIVSRRTSRPSWRKETILGFVWGFMTGTLTIPLIMAGLSIMTGIRHFPTKAWLMGQVGPGKAW